MILSDYDCWKLATPPEYEMTGEEEDALDQHREDCDAWLDREEIEAEKWLNAGDITQEQYDAEIAALRKEYSAMLREGPSR